MFSYLEGRLTSSPIHNPKFIERLICDRTSPNGFTCIAHFSFTNLQGKYNCCCHFRDEETEALESILLRSHG